MRRVLICTVGGSPAPIVHAIQQNRPSFVYFLCSAGTGSSSSERLVHGDYRHVTSATCPHCGRKFEESVRHPSIASSAEVGAEMHGIELVTDPDDLAEVIAACDRILADLDERFAGESVEVVANYTGGTKTMSLGLGLSGLRSGHTLQINASGRRDLIRVTSGDVAMPQDVATILAREAADLADDAFGRHDFEGAVAVLTKALVRTTHGAVSRERLRQLRTRCELWAAIDRFDYRAALGISETDDELRSRHRPRLRRLLRTLELLETDEPWRDRDTSGSELVQDIVDNARRCADRGRYDDAAGRLYRALELVAQLQLLRGYGLRTSELGLDDERLPEGSLGWLGARADGGIARIGLFDGYRLLTELGDALGTHFADHAPVLKRAMEIRNRSLFAHGLTPIDSERWSSIAKPLLAWLDEASVIIDSSRPRRVGS